MGKGLYRQFETDASLETTGIILEYGTNTKDQPIQIRIARAGGANQTYLRRMEIKTKPYRRQLQSGSLDRGIVDKIVREVIAECVVLSWSGVEDKDGNELPFTKDNCIKLFTDLPDLFNDVQEQAQAAALFSVDVKENDSKN